MDNLCHALCGGEVVLSGCLMVNGAEHHVSGELDKGKEEGFGQYLLCLFLSLSIGEFFLLGCN